MTLTRHKSFIEIVLLMLLVLAIQSGGVFAASPLPTRTVPVVGTGERIDIDPLSGLALRGFDPVAYFDEGAARPGLSRHELIWNGAAWRFASAANRAAFERHPAIFQPRFGGYDAYAALRGIASDADPAVFAIVEGKLFLFRSPDARRRFLALSPEKGGDETAWSRTVSRLAP